MKLHIDPTSDQAIAELQILLEAGCKFVDHAGMIVVYGCCSECGSCADS